MTTVKQINRYERFTAYFRAIRWILVKEISNLLVETSGRKTDAIKVCGLHPVRPRPLRVLFLVRLQPLKKSLASDLRQTIFNNIEKLGTSKISFLKSRKFIGTYHDSHTVKIGPRTSGGRDGIGHLVCRHVRYVNVWCWDTKHSTCNL